MDKKIIHEIGNYLHQIISNSQNIENGVNASDVLKYATKIKKSAYSIDALISDTTTKKEEVDISSSTLGVIDFEEFQGTKVMIVDDIDENIEIMKNLFNIFSCEIVSAKSGEEALEVYKGGFSPQFVSMDIIMPGIDGAETTRQLKALGCSAFFMAVSALKNQPKEVTSVFDYWLPKPFTMDSIICALNKYKSMKHLEKELNTSIFSLDLSDEIKDEVLKYAKKGAYTSLKELTKTLPKSDSKAFLVASLERMDFNSIVNSIVS